MKTYYKVYNLSSSSKEGKKIGSNRLNFTDYDATDKGVRHTDVQINDSQIFQSVSAIQGSDKENFLRNLMNQVADVKIQKGLNVFAICRHDRCINSKRMKLISLGYGYFSNLTIQNLEACDGCKHHQSVPSRLLTVGIALKESFLLVDKCESISNLPTPISLKSIESTSEKVPGVSRFLTLGSIFDVKKDIAGKGQVTF